MGSSSSGCPKPPFLPFFLCPDPFGSHPPSLPPSIFIPQAPSPSTQRTTRLTYFGTIGARSAGEAAGPLEALGTRGATFSGETSFTLEWRHHGTVRWRPKEDGEPGRSREVRAELDWRGQGGGQDLGLRFCWDRQARTTPRGHLGMANRTLTLGPTRPGAPASPGTP